MKLPRVFLFVLVLSAFAPFITFTHAVTNSSPVTKADYEDAIAQKEDELQAKIEERDGLKSVTSDTAILKSAFYTKCFQDVPKYNPELMPVREQVCKEGSYGSQCQTERCTAYIKANDFGGVSACASECVEDVKAGKYPFAKDSGELRDIDRLDFEIKNLERDIAELKSNSNNIVPSIKDTDDHGKPATTSATAKPAIEKNHTVRSITGEPEVRRPGGDWKPLTVGMELKQGDEISTDPDSTAEFVLSDGSIVRVEPGSQIKLSVLSDPTLRMRAGIDVAIGRIAARFNPARRGYVVRGDMVLRTPELVYSVRGTILSVIYDPKTRESLLSVEEGEVHVELVSDSTKTITLQAGTQVRSTAGVLGTPEKNTIVSGLAQSGIIPGKIILVGGVLVGLVLLGFVLRRRRA